jgi:hypothetical protein
MSKTEKNIVNIDQVGPLEILGYTLPPFPYESMIIDIIVSGPMKIAEIKF